MKKISVFVILLCLLSLKTFAQEEEQGKLGMGYSLEIIGGNCPRQQNIYKKTYARVLNCHKVFVLYKHQLDKGFYVEPQMALYYMQFHISDGISITEDFTNWVLFDLMSLEEYGLGVELNAGYNVRLTDKLSVDLFVSPDYRCALSSRSDNMDHNFLTGYEWESREGVSYPPIYKRHYFLLKGGIGINYGKVFLNCSYGGYITKRFTLNKKATLPSVLSMSVGCMF